MAKGIKKAGTSVKEPLYYVTNQLNLREILSGGYIGNLESFDDKYYDDLLKISSGRIPLITAPIDLSWTQKVNEHNPEISYAVALQIDPAGLEENPCIEIREDGGNGYMAMTCISCEGVISLKHVSAIHFTSADNKSEFEARQFINMPNFKELYRVSPDLISNNGDINSILQRLREIPESAYPTKELLTSMDKISGAISLCIGFSDNRELSKVLLKLLEPVEKRKKSDDLPAGFNLGFERKTTDEISHLTDINEIVFASAVSVLHSCNPNNVSQRLKILDGIKQLVNSCPLKDEDRVYLDRSFIGIQKILRNEIEFEPFKNSPGHDVLRGLLLFLLRPGHKDLLAWKLSETNASRNVMLTALALSGIVIGRKGLEIAYRPSKPDRDITDLIVAALNRSGSQKGSAKKTSSKAAKSRTMVDHSPDTILKPAVAMPGQSDETSSIDWNTILEKTANEGFTPELIESAVTLCRQMGWNDCITTTITPIVKGKLLMELDQKDTLTIKFPGLANIIHEVNLVQFKINVSKLSGLH